MYTISKRRILTQLTQVPHDRHPANTAPLYTGGENCSVIGADHGHTDASGDVDAIKVFRNGPNIILAVKGKILSNSAPVLYGGTRNVSAVNFPQDQFGRRVHMIKVWDADGHVSESEVTFADKYWDPKLKERRPSIIETGPDGHSTG